MEGWAETEKAKGQWTERAGGAPGCLGRRAAGGGGAWELRGAEALGALGPKAPFCSPLSPDSVRRRYEPRACASEFA